MALPKLTESEVKAIRTSDETNETLGERYSVTCNGCLKSQAPC